MAQGTPAIDQLKRAGARYRVHELGHDAVLAKELGYGMAAAQALGVEAERVFKTLVALVDGAPVVGIVPVTTQLSLKLLAAANGGKRAEMCPVAQAERITGYVAGGISPFGQKRRLPMVIDETCELWDTIFVSAGRRGLDLEVEPACLTAVLGALVAPVAAD